MNHPLRSQKPSILSRSIRFVGAGTLAAAALVFSTESAQAGTKEEYNALIAELSQLGTNERDASAAQIQQAIEQILADPALTNLNTAELAGEALKLPAALAKDAGDEIWNAVQSKAPTDAAKESLIGIAAKIAATGKTGSVTEVPAFVQAALNETQEGIAKNAALLVRSSKAAVGAIIGGFAGEISNDANRATFVTSVLNDPKLAGAVIDIARFSAAEADNAGAFVEDVAKSSEAVAKKAIDIAEGAAAGAPLQAGLIVESLLNSTDTDLAYLKAKATLLAKDVVKVADIEQISRIGNAVAAQIGAGTIKATQAAGLAKTLAAAILAKGPNDTNATNANRFENKADEIAEVAAFVVNGILGNTAFSDAKALKTAPKLIVAVIKGVISGAAKGTKKGNAIGTRFIADVAGSVALTIKNDTTLAENIKTEILRVLADAKTIKSFAGKDAALATLVTNAINAGAAGKSDIDNDPANDAGELEDGNQFAQLGAVMDRETDIQNF